MSNKKEPEVRREKPDPADAKDPHETFLPGQIPVRKRPQEVGEPAGAEPQPNPAEADQAVNPELRDVEGTKKR